MLSTYSKTKYIKKMILNTHTHTHTHNSKRERALLFINLRNTILVNPGVTHSVPNAFDLNAVGMEWVTPGLPRMEEYKTYPFVYVDALHPSQQFFSHVGTIFCLPRLNQYL